MTVATPYLPTPVPTPPPGAAPAELKKGKALKPPYLPQRHTYSPTHPALFRIEFGPDGEEFGSSLRAEQAYKKGDVLCPIRNTLPGIKAYSSVQVLPDPPLPASSSSSKDYPETYYDTAPASTRRHIELNSDLLYVNHSCDPNVVFDMDGFEAGADDESADGKWEGKWKVRVEKDIAKGEILTFAYFSTEWDMDQPFHCLCGTDRCIKTIQGAKDLDAQILDRYFINRHIRAMKEHQQEQR